VGVQKGSVGVQELGVFADPYLSPRRCPLSDFAFVMITIIIVMRNPLLLVAI